MSEQTPQEPTTLAVTSEQRRANLDASLQRFGASGWRIENRSDYQATIAKGKDIRHGLHLFLTIITGVWFIVWIGVYLRDRLQRRLVTVDEYGNVVEQKL